MTREDRIRWWAHRVATCRWLPETVRDANGHARPWDATATLEWAIRLTDAEDHPLRFLRDA
jgi:hypothetical protein